MSTRDPAEAVPAELAGEFQLPMVVWDKEESEERRAAQTAAGGGPLPGASAGPAPVAAPRSRWTVAEAATPAGSVLPAGAVPTALEPPVPDDPGTDEEFPQWRPGEPASESAPRSRISRPMVAAAAAAGLVLVSLPLLFQLGDSTGPSRARASSPPGYPQPTSGDTGLIPSAAPSAGSQAGAGLLGSVATGQQAPAGPQSPAGGILPAGTAATQAASGLTGLNAARAVTGGRPMPVVSPAAVSFSAVAGAGCKSASAGFHTYGFYDQGRAGWATHGGGYTGPGCNGQFVSMPMSGDPAHDDPTSAVTWSFATGTVTTGSCRVQVYIPVDAGIEAVGGTAAYYSVGNASGEAGSFTVDQVTHRGAWVAVGSFRVAGGKLTVELHSRGRDWDQHGYDYAHLAASAVDVSCTG